MSDETKFTASYAGISKMLKSPMVLAALMERAEKVAERARDIAPVGDDTDPHAGRYKASFHTRPGFNNRRNRVEAVVYNDSPEALFVEKGTANNPAYHVLVRALGILGIK